MNPAIHSAGTDALPDGPGCHHPGGVLFASKPCPAAAPPPSPVPALSGHAALMSPAHEKAWPRYRSAPALGGLELALRRGDAGSGAGPVSALDDGRNRADGDDPR